MGDYVNYKPDDVTTAYDKFGETYSGYKNSKIGQDDNLGWRILNINEDKNTIELISDNPTSAEVYFSGARGYNNGVALLNDYCKTMYSNWSKGAVARSLNIEDIQDKMKVNEATGKAYESYSSKTGTVYKTGTYSYSSRKWYPLQWKKDNGIEGESKPKNPESSDIISYASEDNAMKQETSGDLKVTQTYWKLNSSDMSLNFESADTRDPAEANSMYEKLLCKNDNGKSYWLASRFVDTDDPSYVNFGLRYVYVNFVDSRVDSRVDRGDLFNSASYAGDGCSCVRPVVSLPSNVIDLNTDYESAGGWNLK